jgi:predicted RNA-binding protein with PUA-like domain
LSAKKKKMNYWLVKSEPSAYSWEKFLADKETQWTGVRNYAARNHLRSMKKGDEVLFYHSNEGMEIVGIAKVSKEAYQDPTTDETAWLCVDLKPSKTLKKPVPLSVMKKESSLKNMPLIRIPRLSVMPITAEEFDIIMKLV